MYHVVCLVKRHPGPTPEEFARSRIEEHPPLTSAEPGLRASRCGPATGAREGESPFDGVADLAFDHEAAYRAAASPEFAAAIGDAPNVQAAAATASLFAVEHVIV